MYLGARLAERSGRTADLQPVLLEIVRLPWPRHCQMPLWLRERLVKEMTSDKQAAVRGDLECLLLTSSSGAQKTMAIDIGVLPGETPRAEDTGLAKEQYRRDRVLVDFMARRQASPADFPLSAKVARALGLGFADSRIRELFGGTDLTVMRMAATELQEMYTTSPPNIVRTRIPDDTEVDINEVLEVAQWIGPANEPIPLTRTLFLVRLDPRNRYRTLIDGFSMAAWRRRKRLALRFGMFGLAALVVALSVFYRAFFEAVGTVGAAVFTIMGIIYLPPILFWFFLVRPYSALVRSFPTVQDDDLG
jgi:hypothetical protein